MFQVLSVYTAVVSSVCRPAVLVSYLEKYTAAYSTESFFLQRSTNMYVKILIKVIKYLGFYSGTFGYSFSFSSLKILQQLFMSLIANRIRNNIVQLES